MDKLLLTGTAGFIGLNFIHELLGSSFPTRFSEVICLDRLDFDFNEVEHLVVCADQGWTSLETDLCDLDSLFTDIPFGQYTIINFAANSHVDNSIDDPFKLYRENTTSIPNLIQTIGMDNISAFFQIATDERYGSTDGEPFLTTTPLAPRNVYSASKAAQDLYLQSLATTFGFPVETIVLANQFGKRQYPEKMIPASIQRAMRGESIKIYGDGENIREWTYVEDTCKILLEHIELCIDSNKFGGTQHISNPNGAMTNNQLVDILVDILEGHKIYTNIEYIDDRKGHDKAYALYPTLAGDFRNVVDDLETTVDWYVHRLKK